MYKTPSQTERKKKQPAPSLNRLNGIVEYFVWSFLFAVVLLSFGALGTLVSMVYDSICVTCTDDEHHIIANQNPNIISCYVFECTTTTTTTTKIHHSLLQCMRFFMQCTRSELPHTNKRPNPTTNRLPPKRPSDRDPISQRNRQRGPTRRHRNVLYYIIRGCKFRVQCV